MNKEQNSKHYDERFEKLENLIVKVLAQSIPAGTVQPSVAINNPPAAMTSEDHNLLLRIDTKVERVISDVADLRNNFSNRVDMLEREKENQKDAEKKWTDQITVNTDKEARIRRLEQWGSMAIGALFILQIVFTFFIK